MSDTELGFDDEQLAAALERVIFAEADVMEAFATVHLDGSAQVGFFPMQGQAQYSIHPTLSLKAGVLRLSVCVFDDSANGASPVFQVVLHLADGRLMQAARDAWDDGTPLPVFELSAPTDLIGARLEFVA